MNKALIVCVFCLLALCVLSACGGTKAALPAATSVPAETEAPTALPNLVHETGAEGLTRATGLSLPAPEEAENLRYSWVELSDEPPIAELRFTLDGDELLLRAQAHAEPEPDDISGLVEDWALVQSCEVAGRRAVVYTGSTAGHIDWIDAAPGILYSLGMKQGASAEKLISLAERVFTPLQGDAGEAAPEETPDPLYAPYRELVGQISLGLERGWVADLVTEVGISEVFKTAEKGVYGWLQEDINHDGVDELLLGKITAEDEASPFYDIYSILAGEMIHISTGWDYNHWYLLSDGLFVNEWHGTEYETYRTAYGLFNGKLIPANRRVESGEYIHIAFRSFDDVPWLSA